MTACSAAITCLGLALPAGAATDKIVVDEFLLRCADGRPDGAFVELVAAGLGQTFDAALGVRLLGPSGGTVTDLPGVFSSRAGQAWPQGQHFLIATAQFEPLTGVAPDTVFAAPPTGNGGSIVLYRKVGTGSTIQVLGRVDYSSSSALARTPPPGRSASSVVPGLFRWSPDPSPTRSDGVLARAPDCFANPHRPIRVTELSTQCGGGNPAGGFIEISPTADNQALDGDLALRALDRTGATLFDMSLGFGSLEGLPWPTNRAWLAGDSLLQNSMGFGPDLVWPAPLDTVGGRVVLHGLDATGAEIDLADIAYGTPGLPAPPAGASLVWDAFSGRYVQRSPGTPTDFSGAPHQARDCVVPSSIRIRELLTSCSPGSQDSYVELIATADGEQRDSTLTLEIHDATGAVAAVLPAGFGGLSGTPWSANTSWLFATAGFTNDLGAHADVALPVPLDPLAGRIDVLRAVGGAPEVIQSLRWGGTQLAPPPGQALRRFSDTDYRTVTPPQPRASNRQTLRCPQPPDTTIGPVLGGIEVCLGCSDGSQRGQYVRLLLNAGALLDVNFVLRIREANGGLLGTTPSLFASANPRRPADGRSWLVTGADYPAPATSIDALLPVPLPPSGAVEVVWVRDGIERASTTFHYGAPFDYQPPPGYCFRTEFGSDYPSAISFNGATNAIPGCHFSARLGPGDPHITELFPVCSNGDASSQYLELGPVDPDRAPDPRLSLRVLNAYGVAVQSFPHILPAAIPPELRGTGPRTLLVGAPAFEGATGFAPDRTLGNPIPVAAGSLELYFDDPVLGEKGGAAGGELLARDLAPARPLARSLVAVPAGERPAPGRAAAQRRLVRDPARLPRHHGRGPDDPPEARARLLR